MNEFVRLLAIPIPVIKAPKLHIKDVEEKTPALRRASIARFKKRWDSISVKA